MRKVTAICLIFSFFFLLLQPNLFAQKSEVEKLLEEGRKAYAEGNFEVAIEKLTLAITLIKNKAQLVEAYLSLALTYFTIGKEEKTKEQVRKALTVNPRLMVDPEYYPPKFIALVEEVRREFIVPVAISLNVPAKIYIDDNLIGQAQMLTLDLTKSVHVIRAEAPGYKTLEEKIEVTTPNQKIQLQLEKMVPIKEEKKITAPVKKEEGIVKKEGKKKGVSKWIWIGGGLLLGLVVLAALASKKSEEEEPPIIKRDTVLILAENKPIKDGKENFYWKNGNVDGRVKNVRYEITINHPYHRQLDIILVYKKESQIVSYTVLKAETTKRTGKYTYEGSTTKFNGNPVRAAWGLLIDDKVVDGRDGTVLIARITISYE